MFSIGLSEIVLAVEDVRRSAAFYRDVMGLSPQTEPDDDWAWFWVAEPEHPVRIGLHRRTLLFEEHSPLPAGERFGPIHYSFNVPRPRLEAAVEHVRKRALRSTAQSDLIG